MGAFFLSHKESGISLGEVEELYLRKGFRNFHLVQIGDYRLQLYRKQLTGIQNYFREGDDYIFSTGSLFYRGLGYTDSLKILLRDFLNEGIDANLLFGNYSLLFYNATSGIITFCIDPSFIKNVYFNRDKRILSTDFLCIVEASPYHYSFNLSAVAESMTTGHLVSPDTYAVEIEKTDIRNLNEIETYFPGIKVMVLYPDITVRIDSRADSLNNAKHLLSSYFEASRNICREFGATIGLTGGFDSRLLLMYARKKIPSLVTNSFWRPGSDYKNARLLAKAAGLEFTTFEDDPYYTPSTEKMIEWAYLFFDGQIRSQNNWDEEYNMPDYCSRIASGNLVGFHGCGGEQYRNADRMVRPISFKSYILYEWMFRQCENSFLDAGLMETVYQNIRRKICRISGICSGKIGLKELKVIQNEVWNTANRSMRLNTLNQQQFYFAPFTEFQLSREAYLYIPFLGSTQKFQVDLMRDADPVLASVENNYGYNISLGVPFKELVIPLLFNLVPRRAFFKLYFSLRKMQSNPFKYDLAAICSHPGMSDLSEKIDMERLSRNKNLGSSLISYNYLFKTLKLSPGRI